MATSIKYRDLGLINYQEAWALQDRLFNESLSRKSQLRNAIDGAPLPENHLLLCQHPHVYTIGKSGKETNLLISEDYLKEIGAQCIRIDRGGDITYHGPGQIVGYPIFDLEQFGLSLKGYVSLLEDCIIRLLSTYGLKASRLEEATGVWLDATNANARKICAIGVRSSRYITMHGFALNVSTDMNFFSYINPCGFTDRGVTSLHTEFGSALEINDVKNRLLTIIKDAFKND